MLIEPHDIDTEEASLDGFDSQELRAFFTGLLAIAVFPI
jgi:hypothetical protein